ncbi:MAG: type VI secretion system tip protein VgrG [Deltaproteobacteria bacterium]|jgi:type VI secretion system VgrG family protein|nr:type VI secretion system tip protein VgrG [Deltaproteobacteria bacterium]
MPENSQTSFKFVFLGHQDLQAQVVKFTGQARLNSLYFLKILLLVPSKSLEKAEWADFFATPCELTITEGPPPPYMGAQALQSSWTGLLTKMSAGSQLGDHTLMEVELTPRLGLLAGRKQNRVHLGQDCLGVLRDSFKFGGLEPKRFRFEAKAADYPKRDFIFQYEEDLLDFVWRILGFDGLGLYYEPGDDGEVAVIVDHNTQFQPLLLEDSELVLTCATTSGLTPGISEPTAYNFQVESSLPPQTLLLRDYNWQDPNRPLEVRLRVSPRGRGEVHLYGENFATNKEGSRLARIRREEILAKSETYRLTTSAPGFKPGLTFALKGHPWGGFNDRYLTVATEFSGAQTGAISSRLGVDLGHEDLSFKHELVCQKLATPYRPTVSQPRKKIAGSLTAWIDGAGSGETPELDKFGRYKVLLPQDVSGRDGGKASAWIRMAQPYVGNGYGQHFPLTPGVEVLLTFIDGNPDRPVISGAVANAETNSLINSSTSTLSGLGTKGGGSLLFYEKPGKQKAILTAGSDRGGITLSAGSPTTALIHADEINTLSFDNISTIAGTNMNLVGSESSVTVSDSTLVNLAAFIKTLKDTGSAIADLVHLTETDRTPDDEAENREDGEDKDGTYYGLEPGPSLAVEKAMGLLSFGISRLATGGILLSALQALNKTPVCPPHKNLFALTASNSETKSVLRAKKENEITVVNICAFFASLIKYVGAGQKAKVFEGKADNKIESSNKAAKRGAKGLAYTTTGLDILLDVLEKITLVKAMATVHGAPKGMLFQNEDSYVNLRAETFTALSANGPVFVESSSAPLAEILRHSASESQAPSELLQPEFDDATGDFDFDESKAVLLLSDLIRLKAEQIGLQAFNGVMGKSSTSIQLIAGVESFNKLKLKQHEMEKKAVETAVDSFKALPQADSPLKTAYKSVVLINSEKANKSPFPVDTDKAMTQGALIRTLGDEDHILIQTREPSSNIEILHGDGRDKGGTKYSRRILLDENGTAIQNDVDCQLLMVKDSGVFFGLDKKISLQFSPERASLSLDPVDTCLNFTTSEGVSLAGKSQLELSVGNSFLKISSSGFEIEAGGVPFKVNTSNVEAG